jgi:hypothetical protein
VRDGWKGVFGVKGVVGVDADLGKNDRFTHIRGGWSHYTDTSEPVDGYGTYGARNMDFGFWASVAVMSLEHITRGAP